MDSCSYREVEGQVGRWWSVDPVIHPWESSYASFHNNPVFFTDPFGSNPKGDNPPKGDPPWLPDPGDYDIGETWTHEETGHVYRKEEDGEWWREGGTTATVDFAKQRGQHSDVAFLTPVLTPIWDMGSGEAPDPPRPMVYVPQLTITNSGTGTSINGWYDGNQPRMNTPPPGWSLQRPFEKETTAAEWFESTEIPLMAVVRGITEIPARSLEVTANYACILATGKRCDGSDPTPEDLESGYYSLMPGGGKGLKGVGNILKPLGRGSTGRTVANNLTEQLAMKEIMSNPAAGQIIKRMKPLTDPRWSGWRKMQYEHIGLDGTKTIIHYNGKWQNGVLKAVDDFKFK